MSRVLVIDDEASIRESLEMILSYEGHDVVSAEGGDEGIRALQEAPADLVLLDVRMPGRDGMSVLAEIKERWPHVMVIMVSGHASIDSAVEATKRGAFHLIEKPLDRDRLLITVRNAFQHVDLERENRDLEEQIDRRSDIIGESEAVGKILDTIDRVARTDARVLITGENGTGKEHVARRIHWKSRRRKGPFVDINCAAIPPELIESALFGHEKGAFTGATQRKQGTFESAHTGTLFLDEIGDMSLDAQSKVLRVLEESRIQRVGGTEAIDIDVRIIAATNKNLVAEAKEGRFREDLYYRLAVVPIHNPPLRERLEDLPLLAKRFLRDSCGENRIEQKTLDDGAVAFLKGYSWPGNIRELRNVMERMAILVTGDEVTESDVRGFLERDPAADQDPFSECETFEEFKETSERIFIERKLIANSWNIKKTAELLGMQRSNLYKKLEKYGLR